MYSKCPYCHTLFRVHPEQLSAAKGRARCCRCNQVFDAIDHLQSEATGETCESTPPLPANGGLSEATSQDDELARLLERLEIEEIQTPNIETPTLEPDPGPLSELQQMSDFYETALQEAVTEQIGGSDSGPPDLSLDTLQIGDTADRTAEETADTVTSGNLVEVEIDDEEDPAAVAPVADSPAPRSKPEQAPAGSLPFDVPYGLPDIVPSEPPGEGLQGSFFRIRKKKRGHSLAWSLGVLLLLLIGVAQLMWLERQQLLADPKTRELLQQACDRLGCQLPVQQAVDRFQVLQRSITTHPSRPDALLIKMTFTNRAAFPQPYPILQMSLFDRNETPLARRRFDPELYLGHPVGDRSLLQPGQQVHLEMPLVDPGAEATGFKFDFLTSGRTGWGRFDPPWKNIF